MAHQLVDFEQTCNQICADLRALPNTPEGPNPVKLIEAFPDALLCSRDVDEELLANYIEMDFRSDSTATSSVAVHGSGIKMLLSHPVSQAQKGDLLPLALDSLIYQRLAIWMRVPSVFPSVLATGIAMCIDATPSVPNITSPTPEQVTTEHITFILQLSPGITWSSRFAASFTYNFPRRCMYIFLQTEPDQSISILQTINPSKFATRGRTPFLIPSAIMKHHLETCVKLLDETKEDVWQLECKMGIRGNDLLFTNPLTIDLESITRKIKALNGALAWTRYSCRRTEQLLNFMDSVSLRYTKQAAANNVSAAEISDVHQAMHGSYAYLRAWNRGVEDRVAYLVNRLQALSQSVYSSIAQRDSANSIRIAETGTQVAVATSRDSAVMRVITAVTVVFLPATFTATFFSTTFFNFGAGNNGHVYSRWLWLYFVLTLALTAIVIGGTWIMWRAKEREITSKMDDGRSTGGVREKEA